MFRGVATFNLDAKGRMAIPAKFRKHLDACCEGRLVVTDECLEEDFDGILPAELESLSL